MAEMEFPDRNAHRRRRRGSALLVVGAIAAAVAVIVSAHAYVSWRAHQPPPVVAAPPVKPRQVPVSKPIPAPAPVPVAIRAARMTALHAALLRDDAVSAQAEMDSLQNDFRDAIRSTSPDALDAHERARADAWKVAGVRSIAWIDRVNLFAIVESPPRRSQATIDAICKAVGGLTDAGAVVVSLELATVDPDAPALLHRKCTDPTPDETVTGDAKPALEPPDPQREKSLRILRDSTPEL